MFVTDCIDCPDLTGGEGEAAVILATACRRIDWRRAANQVERIASRTLSWRFGWLVERAGTMIPDGPAPVFGISREEVAGHSTDRESPWPAPSAIGIPGNLVATLGSARPVTAAVWPASVTTPTVRLIFCHDGRRQTTVTH